MNTYHKIQSIFKRDPANNHKTFLDGQWSVAAFGLLQDLMWTFTEKIDGTNIRIGWDGKDVTFGGRSDRADIPSVLLKHLIDTFTPSAMEDGVLGPVTLIGEGFGGKIQKGSGYRQDQSFILFDAYIEPTENYPMGIWLERDVVESIAENLNIPVVPVIHQGPLLDGLALCQAKPYSQVAEQEIIAEGVVARPSVELRDRMGQRVITKIKVRDFRYE